ncbi:MAG: hypothetical protein Q9180_000406 [Flavoplaca navasiana]
MTGTPDGIFGTISHHVHRKRRAALGPFYSKAAVIPAEDVLYDKLDKLCQLLKKKAVENSVVELRQTSLALTTDALSHHTFHQSSDLLSNEQAAAEWLRTVKAIAGLTPLVKQYTWIIPLALKLPLAPLRAIVPDLARIVALRKITRLIGDIPPQKLYKQAGQAIRHSPIDPTAQSSQSDPASSVTRRNLFQCLLESKHLSSMEKKRDRITQEAFVVLVAGSETTARMLTSTIYHLLANSKTALARLKEELASELGDTNPRVSVKELEQLPWLLFDTVRERDIDAVRDCFISECCPQSPGVRVKVVKVKGMGGSE